MAVGKGSINRVSKAVEQQVVEEVKVAAPVEPEKKPVVKKPVAKKVAVKKPVAKKPAVKRPAATKPAAKSLEKEHYGVGDSMPMYMM